jgi:FkbM family methyltransferase
VSTPDRRLRRLPTPPRVGRTRFLRLVTRLGQERLLRWERLHRRSRLVRVVAAPLRWWVRRGSARVVSGVGEHLRLSMAHLPIAHAHAGALPRGWLEISVQEALRRLLGPGDVLFDVGANIGFFSLVGSRLVGSEGRVVAFEPVAENVAAIHANAELNGLANITVMECAAGATRGRERLLRVEDLSWSHLESRGPHPGTIDSVEVDVVPIDELVRSGELPPPTAVKIDVEGSEIDVLEGMAETIERHRPAIVCELHETAALFADLMERHGYAVENLEGTEPVREAGMTAHALAKPPG